MSYSIEVIANSSSGAGIKVSLMKSDQIEVFLNTSEYWYYATEIRLGETYADWEMKNPTLGNLSIHKKKWDEEGDGRLIAAFPNGSWEFVRLIESEDEAE